MPFFNGRCHVLHFQFQKKKLIMYANILNQPEHHKKHTYKDEFYDTYIKFYQKTINP